MPLFAGIPGNRFAKRVVLAGATAAATAVALVVAPAAAADAGKPAANDPRGAVHDSGGAMQRAVQRMAQDRDISPAEAKRRLGTQDDKAALAHRLRTELGPQAAGAFINPRTGRLVINVTSAEAAEDVRATKARPRVVDHSLRRLHEIQASLQQVAVTGSTLAIDANANAVEVTIPKSAPKAQTRALVKRVRSYGDAVELSRVARVPRTTVLYGGEAIYGGSTRCSAAFVASDGGTEYVITAGHCTNISSSWTVDEGALGSNVDSSFPGNDYGLIRNSGEVSASGQVLRNGSPYDIIGASEPVQGMQVCKTGSTTGTTCGSVTAYPVTVNYPSGTVRDLIRGNVCVQPGDSGGALYSSTGNQAVGIVSGGSTGGCGGGFTSFFENITEPLGAYGLSLGDGGDDEPPPEEPPEEGTWEPYTDYQAGDQVTYNGQAYECRQAHTSLPGWEPPNTPALWLPI